jgi:hypothetical protein
VGDIQDMQLTIENFKDSKVKERFDLLHPELKSIALEMHFYCAVNVMPFVLTETATSPEEDALLQRKSKSHSESRAIDIRTRDWPDWFRLKFIAEFTTRYGDIGAISNTGQRNFLVYHNSGHGDHIHAQLDTTFAIKSELT